MRIWPYRLLNSSAKSDLLTGERKKTFSSSYSTAEKVASYVKGCDRDIAVVFMSVMAGSPSAPVMYLTPLMHANLIIFDRECLEVYLFEPLKKQADIKEPLGIPDELKKVFQYLPSDWAPIVNVQRGNQDLRGDNRLDCVKLCWEVVDNVRTSGGCPAKSQVTPTAITP
jgi:hypothetical protein